MLNGSLKDQAINADNYKKFSENHIGYTAKLTALAKELETIRDKPNMSPQLIEQQSNTIKQRMIDTMRLMRKNSAEAGVTVNNYRKARENSKAQKLIDEKAKAEAAKQARSSAIGTAYYDTRGYDLN